MSENPSDNEEEPQECKEDPSIKNDSKNRIVILEERDIPFEEERPPNFSPHFSVKIHRIRKHRYKESTKK
ncbi:MAG: hypothetical protein ACFFD8_09090 [Candidatus Thorarchaeota archaeon]